MTGVQHAFARVLWTLAPQGGQKVARRNAWAGMSADASMARARREAAVALERVQPSPERHAAH